MNNRFAPDSIMKAALKVLHVAGYTTRNWTTSDDFSKTQIYDLWEAIHEIPDILINWDKNRSENELIDYLKEYNEKWNTPDLINTYKNNKN